jgi:hypothetical protein
MKASVFPMLSRWKAAVLLIALAVTPVARIAAQTDAADPESLRQLAVSQYIDGATRELDGYRQQINAASRPDNQQVLNEAKAKLDECGRLVSSLRSADAKQFDTIKAAYERTRGELIKAIQTAQKP